MLLKCSKPFAPPIFNFLNQAIMNEYYYHWQTSFLYTQTVNTPTMNVQVICQDIPLKSMVTITSEAVKPDDPQPEPPIFLKPTAATNPKSFTARVNSHIPVGYQGQITFGLLSVAPCPDGSHVSCVISYRESPDAFSINPIHDILVKQVTTTNGDPKKG